LLARKSVKQRLAPPTSIKHVMESFRVMCNDVIRIGMAADVSSMKRLSKIAYGELKRYDVPSYYKVCAISKAAGILSARKKSIRRGFPTKNPCLSRSMLVSCYGFKVENGLLRIPIGEHRFERIALNPHTLATISQPGVEVRSFTLTEHSLSLCIAKEVEEIEADSAVGIDRKLRNVTVGNSERVTYYDVSKAVEIAEATRGIISSFKRNDARIRKQLAAKYGQRRQERVRQILNHVSKSVVMKAKANKQAIALEDISGIRELYRAGNGQGRRFRGRMNSWPFHELKRQIGYKAAWQGVPVITLTKGETKGTTMDCPRCGERLQSAVREDSTHYRQLWCNVCKRLDDRDLIAVINISRKAWLRFGHAEGGSGEAMAGNPTGTVILRVDASKLCHADKMQ